MMVGRHDGGGTVTCSSPEVCVPLGSRAGALGDLLCDENEAVVGGVALREPCVGPRDMVTAESHGEREPGEASFPTVGPAAAEDAEGSGIPLGDKAFALILVDAPPVSPAAKSGVCRPTGTVEG